MDDKIKNLKINRITFLVIGIIICIVFGLPLPPFLIVGALFIFLSYKTNKEYKRLLAESVKKEEPVTIEAEVPEIVEPVHEPKVEPISEEEFKRLQDMCAEIHREYKDLLKGYSNEDTDGKCYVLKECWRKLDVIETTVLKHHCYDDIDIYDEQEKIEKKARSFINSYIKEERESGSDDYMIDVLQFMDSLDFISDYIFEKDEKLNKLPFC